MKLFSVLYKVAQKKRPIVFQDLITALVIDVFL